MEIQKPRVAGICELLVLMGVAWHPFIRNTLRWTCPVRNAGARLQLFKLLLDVCH